MMLSPCECVFCKETFNPKDDEWVYCIKHDQCRFYGVKYYYSKYNNVTLIYMRYHYNDYEYRLYYSQNVLEIYYNNKNDITIINNCIKFNLPEPYKIIITPDNFETKLPMMLTYV